MMNQMRQNMPLILWILVIAFVLTIIFSWGMGGFEDQEKPGVIGIIADQEITYEFFQSVIEQQIAQYTQRTGVEPQDQTIRDIRNQAWDGLIREILLNKEAERVGISVSDPEIVDQVNNNPPQFIQTAEYFQTDGQFDYDKYQAFLHHPQNKDQVIYLEETYRRTLLERKLLNHVGSSVHVTSNELLRRFEEKNITAKADYLFFSADTMPVDSNSIMDEEIEKYYYAHLSEFSVPEKRRMIFTRFDNETSAADSDEVMELADDIRKRLDNGEDFSYLALIYSDHHTSPDSGKLDWIPKGQIEQAADTILWKTPVGEYFGPIYTNYGAHFYKTLAREMQSGELKSDVQIIQLKFMPSADTKDITANKAASFAEDIKENDFNAVAASYNASVDTSGYFERSGSFIPGLGKLVSEVEWVYENPVGSTSDVYPLRNGWLVFKVIDKVEKHISPIGEVEEKIVRSIFKEKQAEAAFRALSDFYNNLTEKEQWRKEAESAGFTVSSTDREFRFGDFVKTVGRDYVFTSSVFRAKPGELYGPVKGLNGSFILELTELNPIDYTAFEKGKMEHLPELLQSKQEIAFERWYEALKSRYKIEDFRYRFYRMM